MEKTSLGNLSVWVHPAAGGADARARVCLLHGLGEHSGRHLSTIAYLNGQNFEVVRFDFRGCGASGGEKQWIESFGDYVDDVLLVHRWIGQTLPAKRLFLTGHSLGGAIALYAAKELNDSLAGLVLSAPAFEVGAGISKWKIAAGRVLNRFMPHAHISAALDLTALSRDPRVEANYKSDPLCCRFNTVRQGAEILSALEKIPERARAITVPTLIVHGEKDRLIPPTGSARILGYLSSTDKTLEFFPGAYHELHNDLSQADYFRVLGTWLAAR